MKPAPPSAVRTFRRKLAGALLGLGVLCSPFAASALEVALALSQRSEAHLAFAKSLRAALPTGSGHGLSDAGTPEGGLDENVLQGADMFIAVGPEAAEALAARGKPTLAVLISAENLRSLQLRHPQAPLSGIVLDQPLERQMRLIRAAMPEVERVGVLLGPQSASMRKLLLEAAEREGLLVLTEEVTQRSALLPALERLLASTEALLVLPDPLAFSAATARATLLTTYRLRRPVVGYSRAQVEAGALAAVYSAPTDAARQAAEWLSAQGAGPLEPPPLATPRYFSLAVNSQVARALSLPLPEEADLTAAIGERESP